MACWKQEVNPYNYEKKPAEHHFWSMIRDSKANLVAAQKSVTFNEQRLEGFIAALKALDPTYR